MRLAIAVVAICSLAGCAELERMNAEAEARQREADRSQCSSYGYAPGTDAFADCMMTTAHRRQEQQLAAQRQADADRRMAEERERDRRAAQDRDAQTQRDIKTGEAVENDAARTAGYGTIDTSKMNCKTTTESTQTDNAGSSKSTTVCHN